MCRTLSPKAALHRLWLVSLAQSNELLGTTLVRFAGVPAHNENDREIAMRLGLPERRVLLDYRVINSQQVRQVVKFMRVACILTWTFL